MQNFKTAYGISPWIVVFSMAATWVWAPAIFVASGISSQWGIEGFLWFFVPNVLALILFGIVASKVHPKIKGFTAGLAIRKEAYFQGAFHDLVSIILAICSTFVQLLGIYLVANMWGNIPRWEAGIVILGISWIFIANGLKSCIKTDLIKYIILLVGAIALLYLGEPYFDNTVFYRMPAYSSLDCAISFGIPTAIGLLSAPYADTTFWQRAEIIGRRTCSRIFFCSAIAFGVIPLIFGLLGFNLPLNADITKIPDFAFKCVLTIVVLSALISTIDSNLCAIAAICGGNRRSIFIVSLILLGLFCWFDKITIVDMFLFYGTLRATIAMPTILILFDRIKFIERKTLLVNTVIAAIVGPVGYALCKFSGLDSWAVLFTIFAVLWPWFGTHLYTRLSNIY